MKIPEIRIASFYKNQLAKEYDVTYTAVSMALKYVHNSKKSKAMRHRAKELLLEEAAKIED